MSKRDFIVAQNTEKFVWLNTRIVVGEKFSFVTWLEEVKRVYSKAALRESDPKKKRWYEKKAEHVGKIGGEDLCMTTVLLPADRPYWKSHFFIIEAKPIDVKGIANGDFLTRDNDFNVPCGTLPMEIWSSRTLKNKGWLYGYLYPEEKKGYDKNDPWSGYVQPEKLVYALTSDEKGEETFCTISFNWRELAPALNEWTGGKLSPVWNVPEDGNSFYNGDGWERWVLRPAGRGKHGNCLYIPLKDIVNLARIVLFHIPTDEELEALQRKKRLNGKRYGASLEVLKARRDYLVEHAAVLPAV